MNGRTASRDVHLIVNPHSGYGGSQLLLKEFRTAARDAGFRLVEFTTTRAGDATRYAAQLPPDAHGLVVWGGDGTVNEVINSMTGSPVPILPCPLGTENLLAKELRIPSDPRQMVEVLRTGVAADCDVGVINGHNFMLIVGIGFDGEVVRRLASTRSGHISHLSYFWPLWRTFWEHDFPRMRIVADGETVFDDYGMAFVGNISRYAVGLRICRDAVYDDGLLDLVVFHCRQQTGLVLHAAWTLLRLHPLKGDVMYRRARTMRIETDRPVPSEIDGDMGPSTPLEISVAPQRVRLLMPRRRPNWGLWPWKEEIA